MWKCVAELTTILLSNDDPSISEVSLDVPSELDVFSDVLGEPAVTSRSAIGRVER